MTNINRHWNNHWQNISFELNICDKPRFNFSYTIMYFIDQSRTRRIRSWNRYVIIILYCRINPCWHSINCSSGFLITIRHYTFIPCSISGAPSASSGINREKYQIRLFEVDKIFHFLNSLNHQSNTIHFHLENILCKKSLLLLLFNSISFVGISKIWKRSGKGFNYFFHNLEPFIIPFNGTR